MPDWKYWLNPFVLDPRPAFKAGREVGKSAGEAVTKPVETWLKGDLPVVGVWVLIALLFLLGVAGLIFGSGVSGQTVRRVVTRK